MPDALLGSLFHDAKLLVEAVEIAFDAEGSFSGGRWIHAPYKDLGGSRATPREAPRDDGRADAATRIAAE